MRGATLASIGERALVARILDGLGVSGVAQVGPGDDAAVLRESSRRQVLTVDRQREGAHFERAWLTPEMLGRRAIAVAASDVGAMGARPRWCLCALELPGDLSCEWLDRLVAGLAAGAREFGCPVVGGDVASGESIGLCITVGGELDEGAEPIRRSGAREGDRCWIAGGLGRAAAGRGLLQSSGTLDDDAARACVAAYREPAPPVELGAQVARGALVHAMMDVSDGLAMDLDRLCERSQVGVLLEAESLLEPVLVDVASRLDADPLDLALRGGDDYALLCAIPASSEDAVQAAALEHDVPLRRIGEFVEADLGMHMRHEGARVSLPRSGWDPFSDTAP